VEGGEEGGRQEADEAPHRVSAWLMDARAPSHSWVLSEERGREGGRKERRRRWARGKYPRRIASRASW
jgi:hypothetical protein